MLPRRRVDHFESGRDFVVSFFTKCAEPSKTSIQVNENTVSAEEVRVTAAGLTCSRPRYSVQLSISTVYERNCTFTKSFRLKGVSRLVAFVRAILTCCLFRLWIPACAQPS